MIVYSVLLLYGFCYCCFYYGHGKVLSPVTAPGAGAFPPFFSKSTASYHPLLLFPLSSGFIKMLIPPACLPVLALAYIRERPSPGWSGLQSWSWKGAVMGGLAARRATAQLSPVPFSSPGPFRRHLLVSRRRLAPATSASNCTVFASVRSRQET